MNHRIEIYHRPFDPEFNRRDFTDADRRALDALNLQTARLFRDHAPHPFPKDPDRIHPRLLAWRSSAYPAARLGPDNMLAIHQHPLDTISALDDPPSEPAPFLDGDELPVLGDALIEALERDALRTLERLGPEPGTQLRHVFRATPTDRLLHFDFVHDPELPDELQGLPGHTLSASSDKRLYLDWTDLESTLMNLSMYLTLGHIPHWDPTEDDPPETRKALVTWIWNGERTQWTRTVRLVPPTYEP